MKSWWVSVTGLVLAASVALYACTLPASPRRIAHETLPSVVSLFIESSEGRLVLSGSGFFVAPTVVATNLHVIEPEGRGFVKHAGQVIGVATALVDGEQNINFALPASLVAQLLTRVNPTALAESLPAALDRAAARFAEPAFTGPPDVTYEP